MSMLSVLKNKMLPMNIYPENSDNNYIEYRNAHDLSLSHRRGLILYLLYSLEMQDYQMDMPDLIYFYNIDYGIVIDHDDELVTFVKNLVSNISLLDEEIKKYLHNWQLERISIVIKLILRYGIFELQEKKNDSKLIINEAVELAKGYAEPDSFRLVNGVLDNYRKKNNL